MSIRYDRWVIARLHVLIVFIIALSVSNNVAAQQIVAKHPHNTPHQSAQKTDSKSTDPSLIHSDPNGDTYGIAPLVQDDQFYYFLTGSSGASTLEFDESWKHLDSNRYGSPGGKLRVIESASEMGTDVYQISVQVTAFDVKNEEEPWVSEEFADSGFTSWRLDIGSDVAGTNQIQPGSEFRVIESGAVLFDSAGSQLVEMDIDDTSDANGVSGTIVAGFTDGSNIAGHDMATIIMYWQIEVQSNDTGFTVTSGQNGHWYDPSHSGEGYVLHIIGESQAVIYWFTYDANGNQVWLFSSGEINGSRIIFDNVLITEGGKFGPDYDPDDVQLTTWGTLELNFSDCNNALASYSGPPEYGNGTLSVTRLTWTWGMDCQGNNSVSSGSGKGFLSPGFSGSWFDPRFNYSGFTMEVIDEERALIFWFTYDTEGNQAWMMIDAEIRGATILDTNVYITSGPKFGPDYNADDLVLETWGAAIFSFGTCAASGHGGSMRYLPPAEFGPESTQLLYRLAYIQGTDCQFLTDTHDISGYMTVAENIAIDGDSNDPNIEEVPNDPGDGLPEQQLVPPAKVAGFVTAEPTGNEGERFELEKDEWDAYILALREGEGVSLTVSDWNPDDKGSVDLDLYLVDVNDDENVADSSLSIEETEAVIAPYDGNYFVMVHAASGASSYLMESGQQVVTTSSQFDITTEFAPSQLMASLQVNSFLSSANGEDRYRQRIEEVEKKQALHRIEESPSGDVLYQINSAQIYRLTPHPLTMLGIGDISPEEWLVVRTAKRLASNPDFLWAAPNYILRKSVFPNDPAYGYQWHYEVIRLPEAWEVSRGSENVIVAILDSGIYDHVDLAGNVDYASGYDFVSSVFNSGDGDGIDSDARDPGEIEPSYQPYLSHGTHVAGTVGARTNNGMGVAGVNWNTTLMPVRVLGISGRGTCFDINEGLRWAGRISNASGQKPALSADVINLSLGGPSSCSGTQSIINELVTKDIVVIAAAGNEGNTVPFFPASHTHVVSVSATTIADELARYSSFGTNVDIAAPGGDTDVDLNNDSYPDGVLSNSMFVQEGSSVVETGYHFLPGTSMAAPHVAGVAALMKSVFPDLDSNHFNTAVSSGQITVDLAENGETLKDPEFGYGRIDALKAVQWAADAEQGQETEAFMTFGSAALNFDANFSSLFIDVDRAGEGVLSVTSVGWSESWISVAGSNLDESGFGRYRINVDRDNLVDGQYYGWISFEDSNDAIVWISVLMRVGESVPGQAGYVYALLLDEWTLANVKFWQGPQIESEFEISLGGLPPGAFYLMVSTDLDKDYTVCDDGELCEIYPSNSAFGPITVSNKDVELGYFQLSFPVPDLKSSQASEKAVINSMATNPHGPRRPIKLRGSLPRVLDGPAYDLRLPKDRPFTLEPASRE